MIKVLLILTSAMLIATAIFGVLNRQSFIDESDRTEDANNKWKVANQELVQVEETLQDTQEELKSAKDDRDQYQHRGSRTMDTHCNSPGSDSLQIEVERVAAGRDGDTSSESS